MDLRGGLTLWQDRDPLPPAVPLLTRDDACDVAIIGGGITGALAAYQLTAAGRSVILLDRRTPANGSTAASTGLLQYEIDVPLLKLARLIGMPAASRAYQLCNAALPAFREITADLADRCGLVMRKSLFLARKSHDVQTLADECTARKACGIRVDFLSREALGERYGIDRPAALLSHDAAQIDPYLFTEQLLARALASGLRAYSPAAVARYQHRARDVLLHTRLGPRIRARHVIFATGYETPEFLDAGTTSLKSTYAIATAPLAAGDLWPGRTLIWESANPYFYARTAGNRIIAGGEDDDFTDPGKRDASIPKKSALLRAKLAKLFPHLRAAIEMQYAWAGTFAQTRDGLPYIGPHPKFPRGWFALGYGGNGITFALIAARLIRDAILKRPTPELPLFRFNR